MLKATIAITLACTAVIATAQAPIPISTAPLAKPVAQKAPSLTQALAEAGRFNIFLTLVKTAGIRDGNVQGVTILAPSDTAFRAMDKGKLEVLRKDPAAAKAFVMAHVVGQPLRVNDMFQADNPTSRKAFTSGAGGEVQVQCNGIPHVGLHHPVINGKARVAAMQDLHFDGGIVQEIDAVLAR